MTKSYWGKPMKYETTKREKNDEMIGAMYSTSRSIDLFLMIR